MFKSRLGRIEYDLQKSRVTGPWDHKVLVSAKKVKKKFHACVPLRRYYVWEVEIDRKKIGSEEGDRWLFLVMLAGTSVGGGQCLRCSEVRSKVLMRTSSSTGRRFPHF